MSDGDAVRLPRENSLNGSLRLSLLKEKWKAHTKENLAVRVVHPRQASSKAPRLRKLDELKIDDGIGEHQRPRVFMEKDELTEDAARNRRLIDLVPPFVGAMGAQLTFEVDVGSTSACAPAYEWTEIFGSERLTGALLDRLTHHVNIIEMNGDSYRLNQSRARKDTATN